MADKQYWTWRGEYFGYRVGDDLFTHRGKHVGKFHETEVYGADGRYLGEEASEGRLITHKSKSSWRKSAFARHAGTSYAKYANYAGFAMYAGHEDFPGPDSF